MCQKKEQMPGRLPLRGKRNKVHWAARGLYPAAIFFFFFNFSKKTRLDISCDTSAKNHMK